MNARLNAAQALSGDIGAGSVVVNDYQIQADAIDGGHRLTITRGSEVQTMDLLDGAQGEKGEKGEKGEPGPAGPQGEPGQDAPQEAVLYTPQSLTDVQQAQARENIGAADAVTVDGLKDEIANLDSVLYTAQSLTYEQQAQARENIAAAGVARVEAVETALGGKLDNAPGTWPVWTADEQAAARERMGIPGDYELIEEIVCDGKITNYVRELEPDGTPYAFRSIYLELEIQPSNVYSRVFFRAYDADGTAVLYDGIAIGNKTYTSYLFAGCYAHSGFYRGWTVATNVAESNKGGSSNMRINKPQIVLSPIKKIYINHNEDVFFDGDKIRIYGVRA